MYIQDKAQQSKGKHDLMFKYCMIILIYIGNYKLYIKKVFEYINTGLNPLKEIACNI